MLASGNVMGKQQPRRLTRTYKRAHARVTVATAQGSPVPRLGAGPFHFPGCYSMRCGRRLQGAAWRAVHVNPRVDKQNAGLAAGTRTHDDSPTRRGNPFSTPRLRCEQPRSQLGSHPTSRRLTRVAQSNRRSEPGAHSAVHSPACRLHALDRSGPVRLLRHNHAAQFWPTFLSLG